MFATKAPTSSTADLWVDRYKPQNLKDLVGNPGLVTKLDQWLTGWYSNNIGGDSTTSASANSKSKTGSAKPGVNEFKFRAVLLGGPPGIGKTSAAVLVAKQHGFEVVEFNASDARNKTAIHDLISPATSNSTLVKLFAKGNVSTKSIYPFFVSFYYLFTI
jgi:replication factor C subunit 1